jgi:hypothetical protein
MDDPVVFACMNALGCVLLYFGGDFVRRGIAGRSHTNEEGVWMTHVPDLVSGAMLLLAGACVWLRSFHWL